MTHKARRWLVAALTMSLWAEVGAAAGCGEAPPEPAASAAPAGEAAKAPRPAPRPPPLYDAEGELLPSEEHAAGIRLPRGFTRAEHTQRGRHVFRSQDIPLDKVLRYFGPRLFTGEIQRRGASVTYKEAVPMDQRDSPVSVDVTISPVGKREVLVHIAEHMQSLADPPAVGVLEKTLRREQKQIE